MTPEQQADYDEIIQSGASPRLAEMLALQSAPKLQTDKRFLRGKPQNGFYSHQLQSWVGSRGDVKRVCAEKNYDCEGSVRHVAHRDMPRPDEVPYRVADDIVDESVARVVDEYPTALQDEPDLRQKVARRLAGDE